MEANNSRTPSYWAVVTVKNGQSTIVQSLESILRQSITPSLICIVDDGSTDSTPNLIAKVTDSHPQIVRVITLADRGYDSRRIVHNWNVACEYVKNSGKEYDCLLISSDDVVFPADYVEKLTGQMADPELVIVSGNRGLEQSDYMSLPEGAGRLIRMSFFKQIGYCHPPYYGYEPWILYKALQLGYKIRKLSYVKYDHLRTFGVGHKFIEYGPAMCCLGYHPLFVLARVARNILTGKTGISKSASVRMLFDYLFEGKWEGDPYFQYFEPDLRAFVRETQRKRLFKKLNVIS